MNNLVQAIENNFKGIEKGHLFNTETGRMIAKTTLSSGSVVYDFGQYVDGKANSLSINVDGSDARIVINNFYEDLNIEKITEIVKNSTWK